jgi:hypothetical protein
MLGRYFNQMKHSFRFNIELPDPNPVDQEKANRLQSQLGTIEVSILAPVAQKFRDIDACCSSML